MKIARCARIGAMAVLATLMLSGTGWAFVVPTQAGPFDFIPCPTPPTEYDENFVEVRRGAEITSDLDLGGTGHCAVNFTGSAGSAGDTWTTRFDDTNHVITAFDTICTRADAMLNKFNNSKGGGLVALLNTGPDDKGLFLLLINNGNTDRLTLNTIDPNDGTIVQHASVPLGSAIVENAWYRLDLDVTARTNTNLLFLRGAVLSHSNPSDPDSIPQSTLGQLLFGGPGFLSALGLEQSGFVGMAAWGKLINNAVSITNFFAQAPCDD